MNQLHRVFVWVAFVALLGVSISAVHQVKMPPSTAAQHAIRDGNGDGVCDKKK